MDVRDWKRLINTLPPDTPVVFYCGGTRPLHPGEYADGNAVTASAVWEEGRWCPCVLVELGEAF